VGAAHAKWEEALTAESSFGLPVTARSCLRPGSGAPVECGF